MAKCNDCGKKCKARITAYDVDLCQECQQKREDELFQFIIKTRREMNN
jgi:hypothetical protein